MKKYLFILSAFIIAALVFAFAPVKKEKNLTTYFYQYTSGSLAQQDIENITNYVRSSESCGGGDNVCGVYLSTNRPLGQQPVATEFNAVKADLWDAQSTGTVDPADEDIIKMKN